MRRTLATALVLTLILAASAWGASARSSESHKRLVTIRLISEVTSVHLHDNDPQKRASRGDVLTIKTSLKNQVAQFGRPKGARVGRDVMVGNVLSTTTWELDLQVYLPGGTLHIRERRPVAAEGSSEQLGTLHIRSGTGRFAGARGTGNAIDLKPGLAVNVYRLQLP